MLFHNTGKGLHTGKSCGMRKTLAGILKLLPLAKR
jgi:hypothetical protein